MEMDCKNVQNAKLLVAGISVLLHEGPFQYVDFKRTTLTFRNLISLWMSQYSDVSSGLTFKNNKQDNWKHHIRSWLTKDQYNQESMLIDTWAGLFESRLTLTQG